MKILKALFLSFLILSTSANEAVTIGGSFTLKDSNQKTFNSKDLTGKDFLVFFGFTRCPSICPTGIRTMTRVQKKFEKTETPLEIIFITIDPEFDNYQSLKSFKAKHGNKLIALRGTEQEIDELIKKFRGYYTKGTAAEIEHSSIIYLMDKKGNYVSHYTSAQGVNFITKDIKSKLK